MVVKPLIDRLNEFAERMREQPANGEASMMRVLDKHGIAYEYQYAVVVKGQDGGDQGFILDFYLPEYKCAIEVDWNYHFELTQRMKDNEKSFLLYKHGIPVIRIQPGKFRQLQKCDFTKLLEANLEAINKHYAYPEKEKAVVDSLTNHNGLYYVDGEPVWIKVEVLYRYTNLNYPETIYL